MARDMPEPCKFVSQLPEEVPVGQQGSSTTPHPVVGLVLQVGDAEKFPQAFGFESLIPFFSESASRTELTLRNSQKLC